MQEICNVDVKIAQNAIQQATRRQCRVVRLSASSPHIASQKFASVLYPLAHHVGGQALIGY
jgi:hypothetical protein